MNPFLYARSAIVAAITMGVISVNGKYGLHLDPAGVVSVALLGLGLMAHHWHLDVLAAKLSASPAVLGTGQGPLKAVLPFLFLLGLSMGGCAALKADIAALTPAQIQAGAAVGIQDILTGWAMAQPDKTASMQTDANRIADLIDTVIVPGLTNAPAGTVLNSAFTQTTTILSKQIQGSKNGPLIVAEIRMLITNASLVLGTAATPTAPMTPDTLAKVVADLNGTSSGLRGFGGTTPAVAPIVPPVAPTVPK